MKDILVIDDFLTEKECDEILELWNNTPYRDYAGNMGIWSYRVKWPEYPDKIKKKIIDKRLKVCNKFFKKKFDMINLNITLWNEGDSQPPHADDGANKEFPNRMYASLIYLNNNYTGGHTYIPELNFNNIPKKGQMLAFPGIQYKHGVTPVEGNKRYTNICWLTPIKA